MTDTRGERETVARALYAEENGYALPLGPVAERHWGEDINQEYFLDLAGAAIAAHQQALSERNAELHAENAELRDLLTEIANTETDHHSGLLMIWDNGENDPDTLWSRLSTYRTEEPQ